MTDDVDQQLLALLSENARAPTAELARKLGLSRSTVQSRIERLEGRGTIAGYGVRLGAAFAESLIRAEVLIITLPKLAPKVEAGLRAIRAVRTLHTVSGPYDMIAVVEVAGLGELDLLLDRIGGLEGVERTQSAIVLSTRFDR
jgi:DNA-binding Lrp family transcriptional regulator